ncbi:unnamed protein product [Sphagnum jensenii]|uniref:UDP-N-acetylmuramate--L-alanine ligase n=1 Tax=Sphagnum jensenii TaxID=128206 RepID=A0ABP0X352_9BRYO
MGCSSCSILGFPTSFALSNVAAAAAAATWRVLLSADVSGQQQKKGWCCGGGGGGGGRRSRRTRTRGVRAFNKKLGWEHGSCGRAGWRVMVVDERVVRRVMKEESSVSPGLVHFVGIGGAGLSALAFLALEQGWQVSGSDIAWNEQLEELREAGARVYEGHEAKQMVQNGAPLPDAVVVSSAVVAGNEEVDVARALGVPVYKRGAWLGKMTEGYKLLAVAGSHGKSTTVAMLAVALCILGEDITVILGAQVPQFPKGRNAMVGKGHLFLLEADEYDGCFLGVSPSLAVVTNVEWEHVDMFPDYEAVRDMFRKFVMRIKPGGLLLVNGDSAGSSSLGEVFQPKETHIACPDAKTVHVETFGLGQSNNWRAVDLVPNAEGGTEYIVVHAGIPMAQVSLRLPGTYNVLNSLAVSYFSELVVFSCARLLSTDCCCLSYFTHVCAVLQGARQRFRQQPIWVIFQPHTFSRLEKLLPDFALAFHAADRVIVTEVYTARNSIFDWNVSGEDLASAIVGPPAMFIPTLEGVVELLALELGAIDQNIVNTQGDVILLTLGAGDITNLGPQLMELLSRGPS